jgi:hypothetical protein
MKFKINEIVFPETLWLTQPIKENKKYFLQTDLHNLDREGYQLLPIEQAYYEANSIGLTHTKVSNVVDKKADSWFAVTQEWMTLEEASSNYFLDHSFIVFRLGFAGKAREQLEKYSEQRPELRRLLGIKPKMGLDFCVDFIDNLQAVELVHIEWDYKDVSEFQRHKQQLEACITTMDWENHVKWILATQTVWQGMYGDDQGNYKVQKFGMPTAMRLVKTF